MQVKWNKRAEVVLIKILKQGELRFGSAVTARFANHVLTYGSLLEANPELGKIEPLLTHRQQKYRSLVIHSHYKLVYHIVGDTIRIADVWDTRANPQSLTTHLKCK